jgi:hypothetical protein
MEWLRSATIWVKTALEKLKNRNWKQPKGEPTTESRSSVLEYLGKRRSQPHCDEQVQRWSPEKEGNRGEASLNNRATAPHELSLKKEDEEPENSKKAIAKYYKRLYCRPS